METKRNFAEKFLFPEHTVEEVMLASIISFFGALIILLRGSYPDIHFLIIPLFGLSFSCFYLSFVTLVFDKTFENHRWIYSFLQRGGFILIMLITAFYFFTAIAMNNGEYNIFDYFFLPFSLLIFVRFIILFFILSEESGIGVDAIENMPPAKKLNLDLRLLFAVFIFSAFIFYINLPIVSIAWGESFIAGVVLIDFFAYLKMRKT